MRLFPFVQQLNVDIKKKGIIFNLLFWYKKFFLQQFFIFANLKGFILQSIAFFFQVFWRDFDSCKTIWVSDFNQLQYILFSEYFRVIHLFIYYFKTFCDNFLTNGKGFFFNVFDLHSLFYY